MNELEKLIHENEFNSEEYKAYRKVEKYYNLCDLKDILDEKLEKGMMSQQNYDIACNKAELIINKYNSYETDWREYMLNAIFWILRGLNT